MKKMTVKLTFTESVLGSLPANEDIYVDYIGTKAPDLDKIDEEVDAISADEMVEKGMTIFPKENGVPFVYDYQIKGFFKDTCQGLRKIDDTESAKIKTFKRVIDKLVFPQPRKILFENYGGIGLCQRPLRAQTPMGERTALAISEEIGAGATLTFDIVMLDDTTEKAVREWLDYGAYSGLGQWRNSGHGRFTWTEV